MLEETIDNTQKIEVIMQPLDDKEKPAKVDGIPAWISDGGGSTMVVSADGLSAMLISSDTPGDTTFTVTVDADLGAGIVSVSDTVLLHVVDAMATHLGLSAGAPVSK